MGVVGAEPLPGEAGSFKGGVEPWFHKIDMNTFRYNV
uniref:Uncharacterized protein n=1 Tax=viral metagenome TaxID=1070528 RepID=A0A6C0HYI5_9ZZZZ